MGTRGEEKIQGSMHNHLCAFASIFLSVLKRESVVKRFIYIWNPPLPPRKTSGFFTGKTIVFSIAFPIIPSFMYKNRSLKKN